MQLGGLNEFHGDLRAAIALNVPVSVEGNSTTSLERVDHLEKSVSDELAKHDTLQQFASTNTDMPNRYRAALQTFEQVGFMSLVFDGLSVKEMALRQLTNGIKWILIYVIATLAVASAGLFWFAYAVVPTIHAIRDDMLQTNALSVEAAGSFQLIDWSPAIAIGAALIFIVALILVSSFGLRRICNLLGGREFVETKTHSIALQNMHYLIESGMSSDHAAKISCDLVGIGPACRSTILDETKTIKDPDELLALSDHATMAANRKLSELKVRIPVRLVVVIGGLISLVYCVAIFWPIISLLNEMVSASYGQ